MSRLEPTDLALSRRDFLKAGGALVIGFSLLGSELGGSEVAWAQAAPGVPLNQLDSWLAIGEDGSVTLFMGKVDVGTGIETAMAQIVAEELDVAFSRVKIVQGDTSVTPDQGGTNASISISVGGAQVRNAAAQAKGALLGLAVAELGVGADDLAVRDGTILAGSSRSITYAQLVGGRRFNLEGVSGAVVKSPESYSIVGQSIPRVDIPSKVFATATYVQDVRVPGMLHGRTVKPTGIGSMLVSVDESSVRDLPGLVQVVVRGNFVGVVAEREEEAIRAAQLLRVIWSPWSELPRMDDIYDVLRSTRKVDQVVAERGDLDAALAGATTTLQASYYFPFQSHGSIGPSCAVADVKDGKATIWSGTSNPPGVRGDIASLLEIPADQVRVIYVQGSGSYGSNGASDATVDAAVLSHAVGRPVRVQWMRQEEHRWATAGPAMVMDLRGGLDADGNLVAWDYQCFTASHYYDDVLAEQLISGDPAVPIGPPPRSTPWGGESRVVYDYPGAVREVVHRLQETPLRSQPLRAPGQIATTLATESFMDELAAKAGVDPVEFRLRYLTNERAIAALKAVTEKAGWASRPSQRVRDNEASGVASGRGVALVQRPATAAGTIVAMVAEVEVDRARGEIAVKRVVVAHDCGLIINPDGVKNQVEGNVIQTISRTLKEEMVFSRTNVVSLHWETYPILTFPEVPEVEIVLIDRPNLPASGVGEPASCPVAAAISNAVFDAIGVRLREVPFTPENVKDAMRQQGNLA